MSEFNLYDAVSAALVKQIQTYMPQVTVRPESVKHFTPNYPYVTYKIYDDYDRVLFNTVNEEIFDIHVQFKAVSNDEGEAKTLGHELRKLFFLATTGV
ncbi:phage neck terminator protein [Levilactobacillus brevis]|uniref:phage neck terminator protein n=1 Tax=Levilactobacillus brevis TaxID=1580 RepID=UPI003D76B0AC